MTTNIPFNAMKRDPGILRSRLLGRAKNRNWPWVAIVIVVGFMLLAILGPLLSPYGQNQGSLSTSMIPPFTAGPDGYHLLGTDDLGRDVATRLVYGARTSLTVGFLGVLTACIVGTTAGIISGMGGRFADASVMRLVDMSMSIPGFLLLILLAAVWQPSIVTIFLALGFLGWPLYARMVRGEILSLRERDYVALAKVAGASRFKIALRHIFPNILPSILVLATLNVGTAILAEAAISFLGVGLPPNQSSWGSMITVGRPYLTTAWWLVVIPGVCISMVVLSFNWIGDWARVRFDPRLEGLR